MSCAVRRSPSLLWQDVQVDIASDPSAGVRDNNGIITRVSEANVCQEKKRIGFTVEFSAILEPLIIQRRDAISDEGE